MLGFAKMKGFSPWPARKLGHIERSGKVWVRFFGKNELGTIPRKNWTDLTNESHTAIGLKYVKNASYALSLKLMITASNEDHDSDIIQNTAEDSTNTEVTEDGMQQNQADDNMQQVQTPNDMQQNHATDAIQQNHAARW